MRGGGGSGGRTRGAAGRGNPAPGNGGGGRGPEAARDAEALPLPFPGGRQGQQQQQQRRQDYASPNGGGQRGGRQGGGGQFSNSRRRQEYDDHIPKEVAKDFLTQDRQGPGAATYLSGKLRVNPKNRKTAFISCSGITKDILIADEKMRNRAIHGDVVVIQMLPEVDWLPIKKPAQAEEESVDLGDFLSAEMQEQLNLDGPAGDVESEEELARKEVKRRLWLPNELVLHKFAESSTGQKKKASTDEVHWIDDAAKRAQCQPTAKVVCILDACHVKTVVGALSVKDVKALQPGAPLPETEGHVYFQPHEAIYPKLFVPRVSLPEAFVANPLEHMKKVYRAEICNDWPADSKMPFCENVRSLGEAGDIHVETEALLIEHCCNHGLFTEDMLQPLRELLGDDSIDATSHNANWRIPESEILKRRDLRDYRIFTIDPTNAKDLDDALHITPLGNGIFELGVHIADVSYFIKPGSPLDVEASIRATSVYLVQKVIPMLPPILCEQLCSLNPNVDRLAFSCIFQIKADGDLVEGHSPWFGKSVIRSCAKLDYATAQRMVDREIPCVPTPSESDPDGFLRTLSESVWDPRRHPVGHAAWACAQDVVSMHGVAMARRAKRKENGALTLFGTKLVFSLDVDGNPLTTQAYPVKESNQLVEEYMLLANSLVAGKLLEKVGRFAFIRSHPPPLEKGLREVENFAKALDLPFNADSARSIQESLNAITQTADAQTVQVLTALLMVPMKPAIYLVAGSVPSEDWMHYALNIPYYTHFTSPIRRFADVCVHRLLDIAVSIDAAGDAGASADGASATTFILPASGLDEDRYKELDLAALQCNFMKDNSQKAQRRSDQVFLAVYLKDKPHDVRGIVIGVGEKSFTVLVPEYGVQGLLFVDEMPGVTADFDLRHNILTLNRADVDSAGLGSDGLAPEAKNTTRAVPNRLAFSGKLVLGIMSEIRVHLSAKMAPPPVDVCISLVGPPLPAVPPL